MSLNVGTRVKRIGLTPPNAVNEVECIHTVQGYDLNYGFVILGPDIYYDTDKGAVCANKANFKDAFAKKKASDDDL